ncbi:MAG: ABC transporter substrate-binding protein [Planctomycetota bacterium]
MQFAAVSAWVTRPITYVVLGVFVLAAFGCGRNPDPKQGIRPKTGRVSGPVRVTVVDDAPFAKVLQRQWAARTDNELELKQMTGDELEQRRRLDADIVIYPASSLGTLVHRGLIAPPSDSIWTEANYDQFDVFDLQRNAQVRWGKQLYAFSFGSPAFVLMYRADLFAQQGLDPPGTWEEYQSLVTKLRRAELGESEPSGSDPWTPVCEPLAAGWAAKTLLARAAPYASHPSQFSVLFDYITMEPLIAGPPFVRALKELVDANQESQLDVRKVTPEMARRRLLSGETAMALSWPSGAPIDSEPVDMPSGIEIAFAELPGSRSAYNFGEQEWSSHDEKGPVRVPLIGIAGRLGSVTRQARQPQRAAKILALLTGPEWSDRLSPSSPHTTLFRESHVDSPTLWTDRVLTRESSENYAAVARATQNRPIHVASVRIPGWRRYLQALDAAVYAALAGESSAQAALRDAAEAWAALTDELGLDSQREAYTRSLGLEP